MKLNHRRRAVAVVLILLTFSAWVPAEAPVGAEAHALAGYLRRLDEIAPEGLAPEAGAPEGLTKVERLDTFGAWLLERLVRDFNSSGQGIDVVGLPARYNDLVHEAQQANLKQPESPSVDLVESAAKILKRALGIQSAP